jgi:hypothetical protein
LFYSNPINTHSASGAPYKVAPFVYIAPSTGAVFFNEDDHCFEFHKTDLYSFYMTAPTLSYTTPLASGTSDQFNWQNSNWDLIYMGNRTGGADSFSASDNIGFAIVKDTSTDTYELLQMTGLVNAVMMGGLTATSERAFPSGIDFDNIKFYAFHPSLPYLFLATEDKVYRVNVNAMNAVDDITATVVPSGQKISLLKTTALRFPATYNQDKKLLIATYDPAGQPGKNGQLALYDVADGTGDLTLAKYPDTPTTDGYQADMKWNNLGKVINVDYKDLQ